MRSLVLLLPVALSGCLWIGAVEHRDRLDFDDDGRTGDLDCDDRDPTVFVGAPELPCDGRDNDCDPATDDGVAHILGTIYDSVQEAIDAAAPGEVIEVCPGTWTEALVVHQPLTLRGALGQDKPVIDATGLGSSVVVVNAGATLRDLVLRGGVGTANPDPTLVAASTLGGGVMALLADEDVVLEGVEVEGNTAEVGAGVMGPVAAGLRLTDSVIRNNTAAQAGGGVALFAGELVGTILEDNSATVRGGGAWVIGSGVVTADLPTTLQRNTADEGGGLWVDPGGTWGGGTLAGNTALVSGGGVGLGDGGLLSGALVDDNSAPTGGGIAAGSDAVLLDLVIANNLADVGAGVLATGTMSLTSSELSGNDAFADGGGVRATGGVLTVVQCTFRGNTAGTPGQGGGLSATDTIVELDGGVYENNSATLGGAVHVDQAQGCDPSCTLGLRNGVVLEGNDASSGGAVWSSVSIEGAGMTLEDNVATDDGGAFHASGGVAIAGCSVSRNEARQGGAMYVSAPLEATVETCDLISNTASSAGAAVFVAEGVVRLEGGQVAGNSATGDAAVHLEPGGTAQNPNAVRSVGSSWVNNADSDLYLGAPFSALIEATFTCQYPSAGAPTCAPGVL